MNESALIIGTGLGLSASLARLCASRGMKVVLAARNINKLIAAKYKEQGWKHEHEISIISEMSKGLAAFEIVTFCSHTDLVLLIREKESLIMIY